jgi:hypothetical protein
MSLPIYVDAHSAYKAYERPRQFTLDEDTFEIAVVEDQWRSPDAAFITVDLQTELRLHACCRWLCQLKIPSALQQLNLG